MNSFGEVLDTLLELDESDRQWLVDQLTPAQRNRLAAQLDAEPSGIVRGSPTVDRSPRTDARATAVRATHARAPAPDGVQRPSEAAVHDATPNPDVSRLTAAPPLQIAELLRREPAWIAHALLRDRPRDWAQAVLVHVPHASRVEINRLAQARVALSPAVLDFLLRAAVLNLPGESPAGGGGSRFDRLLRRLRRGMKPLPAMRRLS